MAGSKGSQGGRGQSSPGRKPVHAMPPTCNLLPRTIGDTAQVELPSAGVYECIFNFFSTAAWAPPLQAEHGIPPNPFPVFAFSCLAHHRALQFRANKYLASHVL